MTASPFEIEIPRGRVIEVQRDDTRVRRGGGLLRGMAVVWKHWKESFKLNRSYSQIHGTFTIEYPEERPRIPEAYRNMPILLYDDETGHELCTSCFQCERICPPQVIHDAGQRSGYREAGAGSGRVYHRVRCLHELWFLRRGLPVRRDQDGSRV